MTRLNWSLLGRGGQGVFFVLLPLACILYSLTLGAYHISVSHVYAILCADITGTLPPDVTAMEVSMIYDVRLPRIMGAVVAGSPWQAASFRHSLAIRSRVPIRSVSQTVQASAQHSLSCCPCLPQGCSCRHSPLASCRFF